MTYFLPHWSKHFLSHHPNNVEILTAILVCLRNFFFLRRDNINEKEMLLSTGKTDV